jgi:hypothetical protein
MGFAVNSLSRFESYKPEDNTVISIFILYHSKSFSII